MTKCMTVCTNTLRSACCCSSIDKGASTPSMECMKAVHQGKHTQGSMYKATVPAEAQLQHERTQKQERSFYLRSGLQQASPCTVLLYTFLNSTMNRMLLY